MLGLRAASPGRFLPLLEARAGLAEPVLLSTALERLLIEEAARAARVPLFDDPSVAAPSGAVRSLAGLIRALRMNRITPAAYADAGGDAHAADAYQRFEQRRTKLGAHDAASRIERLLENGVPAVRLVLDDPALSHRALLDLYSAAIAAAPSCHVGISTLVEDGPGARMASTLEQLGLSVERGRRDSHAPAPAMRAIGGTGMYDEVELVAREMLALLRSAELVSDTSGTGASRSMRPGDILGLAPNGAYLMLLHDACTRLGIPVAGKRRVDALDVPLVRALLNAFELLAHPEADSPERGLALLSTPYVGLSLDEHDALARALTCRALGSLDSWRRFATGTGSHRFQQFAESVPLMAARLTGERSHSELAGSITALALDHHFLANGRKANLEARCDDVVRIDQQGWDALVKALDELGAALRQAGIVRLPARRWLTGLTEILSQAHVAADAKPLDGVRLTVTGAGLPSAAHVFAVGWREGLVPRRTRDDPFLTESVKRRLNELGAIFPLAADRVAHEHERRERVLRAARESLTISYPAVDEDGDPLLPSFYLDDLGLTDSTRSDAAGIGARERAVGDATWPLSLAATRRERVTRATLLARHRPAASLGDELEAVGATLAELTKREMRAYRGRLHAPQVIRLRRTAREEAAQLAGIMSASQARMATHCLYEHFGSRRLALEQLRAPAVDGLLIGNVAHGVLAEIGRAGFDPEMVDVLLERHWNQLVPEALLGQPESDFERDVLASQLRDLVTVERSYLEATGVNAVHFELAFGLPDEGRDSGSIVQGLGITLPPGTPIDTSTLRGSIDRVDVVLRDGKRYGAAIDYKTGKGESYRKEMEDMADFQLPIYCAVLPLFGIEPVGAFYLGVSSQERYGVVRSDFADVFAPDAGRQVKKLDGDDFDSYMRARLEVLGGEVARLARGELAVRPRKDDCNFCELRPVCRVGTFGAGGALDEL